MNQSIVKAIHYSAILAVLGVLSAGGVAGLYALFKPRIEELKAEEEQEALALVLPTDVPAADGAARAVTPVLKETLDSATGKPFTPRSEKDKLRAVHVVRDAADPARIVGYAAKGSARGYGGPVDVVVGVRADQRLTIFNITVTNQNETPGLGANCQVRRTNKNLYQKIAGDTKGEVIRVWTDRYGHAGMKLVGLDKDDRVSAELKVSKDGGKVDAISGATITSRAVSNAVANAVANIAKVTRWDPDEAVRVPVTEESPASMPATAGAGEP